MEAPNFYVTLPDARAIYLHSDLLMAPAQQLGGGGGGHNVRGAQTEIIHSLLCDGTFFVTGGQQRKSYLMLHFYRN